MILQSVPLAAMNLEVKARNISRISLAEEPVLAVAAVSEREVMVGA